ncbi:MAG: hypothetical protein R3C05_00695 [Pirellulaceae bacterium]
MSGDHDRLGPLERTHVHCCGAVIVAVGQMRAKPVPRPSAAVVVAGGIFAVRGVVSRVNRGLPAIAAIVCVGPPLLPSRGTSSSTG